MSPDLGRDAPSILSPGAQGGKRDLPRAPVRSLAFRETLRGGMPHDAPSRRPRNFDGSRPTARGRRGYLQECCAPCPDHRESRTSQTGANGAANSTTVCGGPGAAITLLGCTLSTLQDDNAFNYDETSVSTSPLSAKLVDRNLRTPYQDELVASFERALWTETSIRLRYVRREFRDQFQDFPPPGTAMPRTVPSFSKASSNGLNPLPRA